MYKINGLLTPGNLYTFVTMSAYFSDVNACFLLLPPDAVVRVALHKTNKMGMYFMF